MPRPTDSNPPREIPQWNAAQIATSNQTLNSFIGGRTPTWLVAGSATSPRPNVISSIIHPQKRANLDQDSRAAAPNPSQVTRPQHLQQQQNLLSEYSQNGSGGAEDTQRAPAILPSPAPTDEASPNSANNVDCVNTATTGHAPGIDPAYAVPSNNGQPHEGPPLANEPIWGRVDSSAGYFEALPQPGSSMRNPQTILPPSDSALSHSVPRTTVPSPLPTGQTTTALPAPEESLRPHVNTLERQTKRRRLDSPAIGAHSILPWHKAITERAAVYQGHLSPVEYSRHVFLANACLRNDFFYIMLHQIFCMWSISKDAVHRFFTGRLDQATVDSAFSMLGYALSENTNMAVVHVRWFASFPLSQDDLRAEIPQRLEIVGFLEAMSINFNILLANVEHRSFPLLAWEIGDHLRCPSPVMRSTLFNASCQRLWLHEGPVGETLRKMFDVDQANEDAMRASGTEPAGITQARETITSDYKVFLQTLPAPRSASIATPVPSSVPARLVSVSGRPLAPAVLSPTVHQPPGPMSPHPQAAVRRLSIPAYSGQPVHPHGAVQGQVASSSPPVNNAPPQLGHTNQNAPPTNVQMHGSPILYHPHPQASPVPRRQQFPPPPAHMQNYAAIPVQTAVPQQGYPQYQAGNRQQGMNHTQMVPQPIAGAPVPQRQYQTARPRAPQARAQPAWEGLGAPRQPISQNEWPSSPYGQVSLEVGLHLANVRSPRRVPAQLDRTRFYQFVKRLAIQPIVMEPRSGLRTMSFQVSEAEYGKLSKKTEGGMGIPYCEYSEGSCRYRLRMCMKRPPVPEMDESEWVMSETHWPVCLFIDLNGERLELRRKQQFHKDQPLELTDFLVVGENKLKVSFPRVPQNIRTGVGYYMAVEVVEIRSHTYLKHTIQQQQCTSADKTRLEIQRRMAPSDHDDIIIVNQALKLSLADPFSSSRVDIPVRGVKCRHLECFDLDTWLQTRSSKPIIAGGAPVKKGPEPSLTDGWKCPISSCNLDARPNSLRVDNYFVEVCQALLDKGDWQTKLITIDDQGRWEAVPESDDPNDENSGMPESTSSNESGGKYAPARSRSATKRPVIETIDVDDG